MKTLRSKLLFWYVGSMSLLAVFFYAVVHILQLEYGTEYFILLFGVLAIFGIIIIYNITKAITDLTGQIKKISRRTLDRRLKATTGEDEIKQLATSFNNLLDDLNNAFQREQQFIADVTHEMKTPIATLQSMFEVTLNKKRNVEEYQSVLRDGIEQTQRITTTLNNVLNLAWSETPGEEKKLTSFNLSDLLKELCDLAEKMAVQKKIMISGKIQDSLFILGNREKLARAILNLLDNAIKYSQNEARVTVSLTAENNKAIITIKDTGTGITEEDLPHIFERFYRGSRTKKTLGSGLGLAICQSIVNLHKGYIHAESKTGKGSAFKIVLPLIESQR